jgi:large subunit ribosomal protein L25
MEKMVLGVEKRIKGDNDSLRAKGLIPAIFYGRKEESTPISVSEKEFSKIWKKAGESTIISLHGAGKDVDALILDVQRHPVTDRPIHIDFYAIEKDRKIKVDVPIHFVGESPAEKAGHILVKVLHEIKVESLPANLPQFIEVDLSSLVDLTSQILVKDLKLGNGVEAEDNGEDVIVSITEAREEELEAPVVAPDMASIEVEKKGKTEEAGTDGADEEK